MVSDHYCTVCCISVVTSACSVDVQRLGTTHMLVDACCHVSGLHPALCVCKAVISLLRLITILVPYFILPTNALYNNTLKINTYKHLLKECDKGTRMNCWEAMFIQAYHQKGTLITEQQVTEHNPLFELGNLETTMRTRNT